jgi:hypothetical protein
VEKYKQGTKLLLEEVRKPEQHVSESEMHAGKLEMQEEPAVELKQQAEWPKP